MWSSTTPVGLCARLVLVPCLLASSLVLAGPPDSIDPGVRRFFAEVLAGHAEIRAAEAEIAAARARVAGARRPLYNPELEGELESKEATIAPVLGLSQTLDLYGRGGANAALAARRLATARARRDQVALTLLDALVSALADLQGARALVHLGEERVALLERLQRLTERRRQAGDVGAQDLALARIALAEGRAGLAMAQARLAGARGALEEAAGRPLDAWPSLPEVPAAPEIDEDLLQRLPEVRLALAESLGAQAEIRVAERDTRADPTVGVRLGRDVNENFLGVNLAVPLFVRNDFREGVRASSAAASAAAARAEGVRQIAGRRLAGARARYRLLRDAWEGWRAQGGDEIPRWRRLLERLWRNGEISTPDYLVQIQQGLDTQAAGVELQNRLRGAWVALMSAAGLWLEGEQR